jgi:membrane protease YdiL (CAAX protease family)
MDSTGDDALRAFTVFLVGTLGFSWGLWALLFVDLVPSSALGILARVGGFGPLVGALVALYATGGSIREWVRSNVRIRIPARWFGWALVLPPLFIGLAGLVHVVVFGASVDLDAINPLWFYPIGVVVVFFVGGGQEELGWRGFALPALQQRFSALLASLAVGLVWVLWHLPLFFLPGSTQSDLPLVPYVVALLFGSIVFTWLYNSSGSVLVPMLYHGGINPIAAYFPTGGVEAVGSVTGYGSYTLVLVVAGSVLLAVYGSRRLSNRPRVTLAALVAPRLPAERSRRE